MPEQEWGTKRLCPSCGTRFYDLNNDPTTCPNCGTVHELSVFALAVVGVARTARAARPAARYLLFVMSPVLPVRAHLPCAVRRQSEESL